MKRIQLVGFRVQKGVISSLYIVAIAKLLKTEYVCPERGRWAKAQFLYVNEVFIAIDMMLINLELSNNCVGEVL